MPSRVEVRLIARNNEVLASRTTDAAGFARFGPGFARGEAAGARDARRRQQGDFAFLSLKVRPSI
jgi:uncharacterized protein YfaS (alpha-2-macroglobulin family)